jgi:hypothetical protein
MAQFLSMVLSAESIADSAMFYKMNKTEIKYRLLVSLMPFVVMTLFREKKFSKSPQAF